MADLESDLTIANDKKYRIEWENKLSKLNSIKNKFLKEYKENLNEL